LCVLIAEKVNFMCQSMLKDTTKWVI